MQQATPLTLTPVPSRLLGHEEYSSHLQLQPVAAEQLFATVHSFSPISTEHSPKHFFIPSFLSSLTSTPSNSLPAGWKEFVLPEGQRYFYHSLRRIITRSDIKNRAVFLVLVRASVILGRRLVLPETAEIILHVDPKPRVPYVGYYGVDHAQRVTFWLEDTTTEGLNFPPATSFTQLRHLLKQQYWVHIESYPMHHKLSGDARVNLITILNHACADYTTSLSPIIPYTREQCETLLNLLNELPQSDQIDVHQNCTVARLQSEIEFHYFISLFGEDKPNLTRAKRTRGLMNFFTGTYL